MVEETVTKPMSLMDIIPPLLPADTTPPSTHTPSSTRTPRPRPARHATPERVHVSRKRVHTQRDDMVQEQLLPRKRGKTGGVAKRSGSAGADDDAYGVDGAASTRVGIVRRDAMRTRDVVVKEEATSSSVLFPTVGGGVSGGSGGSGLSPTRDVEAEVDMQGDDSVKIEVKREMKVKVKGEVKREVKEESSDGEVDEDGEYYEDDGDEDVGGSEDSNGDGADLRSSVQLTATQSDTRVRTRRNPWVCATNPHGFKPATLARLQALSPEAREREVKRLLQKRECFAKRRSDPAVRQTVRVREKERYEKNKEYAKQRVKEYREKNKEKVKQRKKEYREKNKEKLKQRKKEYYEKNKEKVKQRKKEYYEKNKEKEKQREKEYYEKNKDQVNARQRERRARQKVEREAAQRATAGDPAESV